MLRQAAKELDLDLTRSFMIGDKASDIEAGKRAGCRTILLVPGDSESGSPLSGDQAGTDFVVGHWTEVLQHLLGGQGMVT
jgi:phosphoglycolate phosphatase-like HAD superfamily hydrolase